MWWFPYFVFSLIIGLLIICICLFFKEYGHVILRLYEKNINSNYHTLINSFALYLRERFKFKDNKIEQSLLSSDTSNESTTDSMKNMAPDTTNRKDDHQFEVTDLLQKQYELKNVITNQSRTVEHPYAYKQLKQSTTYGVESAVVNINGHNNNGDDNQKKEEVYTVTEKNTNNNKMYQENNILIILPVNQNAQNEIEKKNKTQSFKNITTILLPTYDDSKTTFKNNTKIDDEHESNSTAHILENSKPLKFYASEQMILDEKFFMDQMEFDDTV